MQLLDEFEYKRVKNLNTLKKLSLQSGDYTKKGVHPVFGEVTLAQLLTTWVVYDLNHLAQITRIMAKQYHSEVGPWVNYLKILN